MVPFTPGSSLGFPGSLSKLATKGLMSGRVGLLGTWPQSSLVSILMVDILVTALHHLVDRDYVPSVCHSPPLAGLSLPLLVQLSAEA